MCKLHKNHFAFAERIKLPSYSFFQSCFLDPVNYSFLECLDYGAWSGQGSVETRPHPGVDGQFRLGPLLFILGGKTFKNSFSCSKTWSASVSELKRQMSTCESVDLSCDNAIFCIINNVHPFVKERIWKDIHDIGRRASFHAGCSYYSLPGDRKHYSGDYHRRHISMKEKSHPRCFFLIA